MVRINTTTTTKVVPIPGLHLAIWAGLGALPWTPSKMLQDAVDAVERGWWSGGPANYDDHYASGAAVQVRSCAPDCGWAMEAVGGNI